MSKSAGTGVFLDWDANQMFGGVMAQPDENMQQLFLDVTLLNINEINEILLNINPKEIKIRLAREIVSIYHGGEEANKAEKKWEETFSQKVFPEDAIKIKISNEKLIDILTQSKIVESKTEVRRLIDSGSITNFETGEKITDLNYIPTSNQKIKIGKRRFIEISTE